MANKQLYLSSLGAPNHADWECKLPNAVTINPYSEVRVISCRINLDNNVLEIDEDNDTFYVGVDHWLKQNSCIPLLRITLDNGLYSLNTNSDYPDLAEEIEKQLAEELKPYCYLRGGATVEFDGDDKLAIKISIMQMYNCPTIALTQDVADFWANEEDNQFDIRISEGPFRNEVYYPTVASSVQLAEKDEYFGLLLDKLSDKKEYFVSAPVVTGFTGGTKQAKFVSHVVEADFSGIPHATELGATHLQPGEFIRLYFGDMDTDEMGVGPYWGGENRFVDDPDDAMVDTYVYAVEFTNQGLVVKYNGPDDTHYYTISASGNPPKYQMNSSFLIEYEEWEDEYNSWYNMRIRVKDDQGDFNLLRLTSIDGVKAPAGSESTITVRKDYARQKSATTQNKLGVMFHTTRLVNDCIKFTAAVDDDEEKLGFNGTTGAFGGRASLNAQIPNRLLSIVADDERRLSQDVRNEFRQDMLNEGWLLEVPLQADPDYPLDELLDSYKVRYAPSLAELGFGDTASGNNSYTGLTAQKKVDTSHVDFPMFYLSIPSLPIRNYSAGYTGGIENQFVCGIELAESETSNTYTSKMFTKQYTQLTNSAPMSIDSIRLRITDVSGRVVKSIRKNTNVIIEIRDNKQFHNDDLVRNRSELIDRDNKDYHLYGNQ